MGGGAWFGGGCDLTPAYLNEADARAFHAFWRQLCAPRCSPPLGQHRCMSPSRAPHTLTASQAVIGSSASRCRLSCDYTKSKAG